MWHPFFRSIVFTVLVFLVSSKTTHAQTQTGAGNWFVYFGNQAINKRFNFWNELQYRNYNFVGNTQQLVFRVGLGYNLTENNNNVLIGYGFIYSVRVLQ